MSHWRNGGNPFRKIRKIRILLVLLPIFFHPVFAEHSGYWIDEQNIHHRTDTYKQGLDKKGFPAIKTEMDEDCRSKKSLSYYTCYNLAVYLVEKGRKEEAKKYLTMAFRKNNNFYEPVNMYFYYFPESVQDILALSGDKKYYYYILARNAAAKKNLPLSRKYLYLAGKAGMTNASLIYSDPAFKFAQSTKEFSSFVRENFVEKKQSEVTLLSYLYLKKSPLFGIIDEEYTLQKHKLSPNPEKVLYYYYRARGHAYSGNPAGVRMELDRMFAKLDEKKSDKQHILSLKRYMLLFINQSEPFVHLKDSRFQDFLEDKKDEYGIKND